MGYGINLVIKLRKTFTKLDKIDLIKHGKNYLMGTFFIQGLNFISIPILTRMLTPSEFGIISIFTSVVNILTILIGLNTAGAFARKYYEKSSDYGSYLYTNFIFTGIFSIICLNVFLKFSKTLSIFFNLKSEVFIFGVIVSVLGVYILQHQSYLQASKESLKYSKIGIFQSLGIIILTIILIILLENNKFYGRIYAQMIVFFILMIYSVSQFLKKFEKVFNKRHIFYSLSFGLPLIPHALSGFILSHFDRVIINQLLGSFETGIYSFAYNVGMIMHIVVMALNKAWVPVFYEKLNSKNYKEIESLKIKYVSFVAFVAILLIVIAKPLVLIMASKKYYEALKIVPVIIVSYLFVFLYTLYANYLFYLKKTIFISLGTILAGVLNITLNYIFIPKYGIKAAAWTTLISYIVLFVYNFVLKKVFFDAKKIA